MAKTMEGKKAKRLGAVICTRILTMALNGKTTEVIVQLGRPRTRRIGKHRKTSWVCSFQISGIGVEELFYADGADGFQALMQALIGIRIHLDRTGGSFSGWIDDGHAGFPKFIHEGWGLGFIQKCEALLDAEHAKLMEEIEQRRSREGSPTLKQQYQNERYSMFPLDEEK